MMSSANENNSKTDVVAIIPARGGSKGLPGKNLRELGGKPLLWYTIQASIKSRSVSATVVSTEDDQIAKYALSLGVPVLRHPGELSTDDSPTYPVVRWALNEWGRRGNRFQFCAVLRATTPLRSAEDIDDAIRLLTQNAPTCDSVVSVRRATGMHPIRLKRIVPTGWLVDAFEKEGYSPRRRQELEPFYVRNGGIYLTTSSVVQNCGLWGAHCLPYLMPEHRSININTEYDFMIAELLLLANDKRPGVSDSR